MASENKVQNFMLNMSVGDRLARAAKGVGGFVFGNDDSVSGEERDVERFLDRISNGTLVEDRRAAMAELQVLVAESRAAQMALGAIGFSVLLNVLKEERDDVELIRGALETLVSALTPIGTAHAQKSGVQPSLMNSDLLSRESDSISLLLSLLSEDDFYVRYYTLQLLTALLTHSSARLQEAILSVPRGITRLMDMLMDREVIRNEALLLLTYLTREAEEIQKIVVFEGAFEKIFAIIQEEGGSDGGVVVQDCLELLNNLLRNNTSNQVLLKETIGFDPLVSILKLRRGSAYNFTQQKTINLLNAMGTVELLLTGSQTDEAGKNPIRLANQTALAQNKILDHLLLLGVESQWASLPVRCLALRCVGDLVSKNPQNLEIFSNKFIGEDPHVEPALNAIFRILLRSTSMQEFMASDYVFKCFCEGNAAGQSMLASTITPPPSSTNYTAIGPDIKLPVGSLLLQVLVSNEGNDYLEVSSRAVRVLSHILKGNQQCKERVLKVELDPPVPSLGAPEPLLHRIMKYLALAASTATNENYLSSSNQTGHPYIQPFILQSLITWFLDCPNAVNCFLASPAHLTYLLELVVSPHASVYVQGLAAVVLGECVVYNKFGESNRDAFAVVDALSKKIGLTPFFLKFDELRKSILSLSSSVQNHKPLVRSTAASITDADEMENNEAIQKHEDPILAEIFDPIFVSIIEKLETDIREQVMVLFSNSRNKVTVLPAELEQNNRESDDEYIKRLKKFVEMQCQEMQDLLARNATLTDELVRTGGGSAPDHSKKPGNGIERVQSETLRQDLREATKRLEILKSEKAKVEAEASNYQNLATKLELELKSLSAAYSSLEQTNFRLETEMKTLRKSGDSSYPDIEAIREEAREAAQKESEAELNDLLVCLGQEQSKVEKLSSRLTELGEDVDSLLEGIGEDAGFHDDDNEDEDEEDGGN